MSEKKRYSVSVVIPNFNGQKILEKNLPYLITAKENSKNNIEEIIVVDDGSTDDSVNFLKKNYPSLRLFKHRENRGFSASVNAGVRVSKGNFILLLNIDVVPKKDFLEKVLSNFKDEKVFAVALHQKGYGFTKGVFTDGYINLSHSTEAKEVKPTFYVSGGFGLFRKDIWSLLGGMDERLLSPFYWEDVDLSYRAAKRGYKLLWEPGSIVEHNHEFTNSKFSKSYMERIRKRNELLLIWKNITSPNLTRKHVAGLLKRVVKNPTYLIIVFMALAKFGVVNQKRKKEIKESRVSDEAVFAKFT